MTDEEFKSVIENSIASLATEIASLVAESKETDRKIAKMSEETDRKIDKRSAETDRKIDKRSAETDRKIDKVSEQIDKVSKQMGGINENLGHHAEQFFQNVFMENRTFGGIKYDDITLNLNRNGKVEFDIFLENGNSVAIIEVKNRIHPDFVKDLAEDRVSKFRKYFPLYKDYDVYLGVAGFSFEDAVLEEARKYGVGLIRQVGEGIEIDAAGLKVYR